MVTFFQLIKKNLRKFRQKQCLTKALKGNPQRKGICSRVFIMTPKKPCSARRKVLDVFFPRDKRMIIAYIPGEGHTLTKFSRVLVRGGLRPDLPGVHYILIRGKLDLHGLLLRKKGRSRYGTFLQERARKRDRRLAFKTKKK
jgi:small subunit ribosomal protein S12